MVAPLFKRLSFALVLILVTALVCWRVLPRFGFHVPWWVPLAGFVVIALAALATIEREEDPGPGGPIPFRPPTDGGDTGDISAADRERFG